MSGDASGMSSGASVGPPGVATMATDRSASAWVSRFVGYTLRRSDGSDVRSSPATAAKVTPEPSTTISRQPSRSTNDVSAKVTSLPVTRGCSRRAVKPQTRRIVERPPTPGGNVRPASVSVSIRGAPSTMRVSADRIPAQAVARPASVSLSETLPSPSVSKSSRAWKVGISAWSMTMSRRIRSGSTRTPA